MTVPTSGSIQVRVRYAECDPMGVAHHASFVPWLEMGRTELLRDHITYAQLEREGVYLVIVKLDVIYKRPAHYDDLIEVRTQVVGSSRVKIRHRYEVVRVQPGGHASSAGGIEPAQRPSSGDVLATAETLLASVDRTGRPAPLPEWLAAVGQNGRP